MSDPEQCDAIVIGGGKGGKTLAMYLGRRNDKTALIERDPMMIGGGCINVACIPTKTFIASARQIVCEEKESISSSMRQSNRFVSSVTVN